MSRRPASITQADVARVMRAAAQAWPNVQFRIRIFGGEIVAEPHPVAPGTPTEGSSASSPADIWPAGRAVGNNPPVDGQATGSAKGAGAAPLTAREWRL
jgi:hypothetical protein